jgi:hypothetical protein
MAWNLSNPEENQIELTNEHATDALLFTIHKLNTDEEFEPISDDYTELPTISLAADSSVTIDLVDDGVYLLIIDGSPDTETYFLMDYNIKACERDILKDLLCDTCDPCESVSFMKKMKTRMVFNALKNNLYFIWNKWVQTQSVTDLITPPNDEILYLGELITQLNDLCTACSDSTCDECGRTVNISSNCGCS